MTEASSILSTWILNRKRTYLVATRVTFYHCWRYSRSVLRSAEYFYKVRFSSPNELSLPWGLCGQREVLYRSYHSIAGPQSELPFFDLYA